VIASIEKRICGTRGEQGIHAACGVPASGFALASAKTGRFPPPPPPQKDAAHKGGIFLK
jgi:hypothetical protein